MINKPIMFITKVFKFLYPKAINTVITLMTMRKRIEIKALYIGKNIAKEDIALTKEEIIILYSFVSR